LALEDRISKKDAIINEMTELQKELNGNLEACQRQLASSETNYKAKIRQLEDSLCASNADNEMLRRRLAES
jgi:hypothetical protein